jgi:hypothetical protein
MAPTSVLRRINDQLVAPRASRDELLAPEVIEAYLRIYQEVLAKAWARCWRGASTGTRPGEGPERLRLPTSGYGVGRSLQGTSDWRAVP